MAYRDTTGKQKRHRRLLEPINWYHASGTYRPSTLSVTSGYAPNTLHCGMNTRRFHLDGLALHELANKSSGCGPDLSSHLDDTYVFRESHVVPALSVETKDPGRYCDGFPEILLEPIPWFHAPSRLPARPSPSYISTARNNRRTRIIRSGRSIHQASDPFFPAESAKSERSLDFRFWAEASFKSSKEPALGQTGTAEWPHESLIDVSGPQVSKNPSQQWPYISDERNNASLKQKSEDWPGGIGSTNCTSFSSLSDTLPSVASTQLSPRVSEEAKSETPSSSNTALSSFVTDEPRNVGNPHNVHDEDDAVSATLVDHSVMRSPRTANKPLFQNSAHESIDEARMSPDVLPDSRKLGSWETRSAQGAKSDAELPNVTQQIEMRETGVINTIAEGLKSYCAEKTDNSEDKASNTDIALVLPRLPISDAATQCDLSPAENDAKTRDLEATITDFAMRLGDCSTKCDDLEADKERHRVQMEELRRKHNATLEEHARKAQEIQENSDGLVSVTEHLRIQIDSLTREKTDWEKGKEQLQKDVRWHRDQYREIEIDHDRLKAEYATLLKDRNNEIPEPTGKI